MSVSALEIVSRPDLSWATLTPKNESTNSSGVYTECYAVVPGSHLPRCARIGFIGFI